MKSTEINNQEQLSQLIQQLKAQSKMQEEAIIDRFNEFVHTINPITIVKSTLSALAGDTDVHYNVAKLGLNAGANVFIDQFLGKYRTIKGFVSSIVAESISSTYINNNASQILSRITNLIGNYFDNRKSNSYKN